MICFHIVHKNVKHLRDEPPIFIPCLLWPNAGMEQDAIWYRGRPWPGHIVLNGDPAPPQKKGAQPPTFGPCPLWPSDWMDKMPLGMEVGLGPGDIVLDRDPAPLQKSGHSSPNFGPYIVAKRLDGTGCCLVWN